MLKFKYIVLISTLAIVATGCSGKETAVEVSVPSVSSSPSVEPTLNATAVPKETESKEEELSKDRVIETMGTFAKAGRDYLNNSGKARRLGTKNGELYDFGGKTPVKYSRIVDVDKYPYINFDKVWFLVLEPEDLREYPELKIKEDMSSEVFCAYQVEGGYEIVGEESPGGFITFTDFNKMLSNYEVDYGEKEYIESTSPLFDNVVKTVMASRGSEGEGADVRYMVEDDRFIVVVLSPVSDSTDIEGYVLEKDGDSLNVVFKNFENYDSYEQEVTMTIPKFNYELLPNYNLYSCKDSLTNDFDLLIESMETNGIIGKEDKPLKFGSAYEEFCYLEFQNDEKFVGYGKDQHFVMFKVETMEEAENKMLEYSDKPPYFILKQF